MMVNLFDESNNPTAVTHIHQIFIEQALITPDFIAIEFNGQQVTYRQLNQLSDAIAHLVLSQHSPSPFVGISTTRGVHMVAGLLGILKSGKAYLPIDPSYPLERMRQMIGESNMDTLIAPVEEERFFTNLKLKVITPNSPAPAIQTNQPVQQNLAYVLYTSGSTGKPKGVCMGHRALVNLLQWQQKAGLASIGNKTLQFAPLSFDVSFQEIFSTLTTGGTIVLIGDDLRLDPYLLLDFIGNKNINRLFLPFIALQNLTAAAETAHQFPVCLQEIITAGEQLKVTPQIAGFFDRLNNCTFYNQYGPTECHVVTQLQLSDDKKEWKTLPSIGKAISNVEILILDDEHKLLPDAESGELCIAGLCLADGYLGQPELTAEKFICWLHPQKGRIMIYKSGDYAKVLTDGNIEFLGRKDDQVKIRGYRVELGEVEVVLNGLPQIGQAAVAVKTDKRGLQNIVAYVVSSGEASIDIIEIKKELNNLLPNYMVPSAIVQLDTLPKTTSGKIDRKALPEPGTGRPEISVRYKNPDGIVEKQIAAIWEDLLQIDQIGTEDNFFDLGGNSLLALKSIGALRQRYNYSLPVTKLYQHPTIKGIATFLEELASPQVNLPKTEFQRSGKDIAVIGMAGRFPGADTVDELWELLKEGKEAIQFFNNEELDPFISRSTIDNPDYVKARGIISNTENFDPDFFKINPKVAELMDPQQRIFLEIAWEVLESTGHLPAHYEGTIGVFAGSGNNTYYTHNVLRNQQLIDHVGSFQVMTVNEKDYIATRTAYQLDLKGPAVSVHTGCSTSLMAIAQAVESIRSGRCDAALAGGVSITSPVKSGYLYNDGAMLSPDGHCRPFDADAQGTVFSDGAGVVLLKPLEQAIIDGDTIYSVIKGIGMNNDGYGKGSFTAPSAEGQAGAIGMAIADAGIEPSTIGYIETHGTATLIGDPIELEGLKIAFNHSVADPYCALGSLKSNLGHLTAAAGVAGFIKATLSLYHRMIPATINYKNINPHLGIEGSPFYINDHLRRWDTDTQRRAGVSSFGVGGTNVHVVLEEFTNPLITPDHNETPQLITWSAKTETSLYAYAEKLASHLTKNPNLNLAAIDHTLRTTREDFEVRGFVVASDVSDLKRALLAKKYTVNKIGKSPADVVFMFAGQGSQQINMCKALYEQEPVFKQATDECATILKGELNENILEIIYPAADDIVAEDKLNNTFYTQPALFLIEYALAKLWMSRGVKPVAMVGHSIGELVAAHLSGIFTLPDALKLIAARGRLMSRLPKGSMLAVSLDVAALKQYHLPGLSIAAINTPKNTVVSGPVDIMASFGQSLAANNIPARQLKTSHAFHSVMMEPAVAPFLEIVKSLKINAPSIPIISTATGKWLSDNEAVDPEYWSRQLILPVLFADALQILEPEDGSILLEIGPGNRTSAMALQNFNHTKITAIASIGQNDENDLTLTALGKLWLKGVELNWASPNNGKIPNKINLPNYAFDRKRCWVDPVIIPHPHQITITQTTTVDDQSLTGGESPDSDRDMLERKVRQILEDASGIDLQKVGFDTSFIEMGFDSLLLTQVTLNLKNEFNLPITFRKLNDGLHTLSLLCEYIYNNLKINNLYTQNKVSIEADDSSIASITRQLAALTKQVASMQNGNRVITLQNKTAFTLRNEATISPEEVLELKKPFGATARIDKQAKELTAGQKSFLTEFIKAYNQKTAKSKNYTQQHRLHMADPRVVSGFRPQTKEVVYPIVVNRSKGSRLWDIDGNEYIDALNGFGSNLLGYQPDHLKAAVLQQVENGYEIGPQHELAGDVCRLICEFTGFDRAALCNTGSEAVLGAIRIARTVTGRSTIVAFSGSYHGINDEVIVRGTKKLKSFPAAPGIMPEAVQNMLILDYGTDEALQIIKQRGHELAAILVEPVQSRRPEFQPVAFLHQLRKIASETGAVLIFDEVITGFRMHPGGAQALLNIKADLGTYGKVIGGGMPIGAIAGKQQYLDALDGGDWHFGDDSVPEAGVTYFAGTFVRHPLALAAGKASMEYMKLQGPGLQKTINDKTAYLANALNTICEQKGLPLFAAQYGSLWKLKFKQEIAYSELLFTLMRYKGIHIWDNFPCFLTEAHTIDDVDTIIHKFEESTDELIQAGFFKSSVAENLKTDFSYNTNNLPPVPGARLGRDEDGNPAWYISDEESPGKYVKVEHNY